MIEKIILEVLSRKHKMFRQFFYMSFKETCHIAFVYNNDPSVERVELAHILYVIGINNFFKKILDCVYMIYTSNKLFNNILIFKTPC